MFFKVGLFFNVFIAFWVPEGSLAGFVLGRRSVISDLFRICPIFSLEKGLKIDKKGLTNDEKG